LDLAAQEAVLTGVDVRDAQIRGAGGFNHDSIVHKEGIITCKSEESFLRME
jgi:hypothetical protein